MRTGRITTRLLALKKIIRECLNSKYSVENAEVRRCSLKAKSVWGLKGEMVARRSWEGRERRHRTK
jgi:hypothetical protein